MSSGGIPLPELAEPGTNRTYGVPCSRNEPNLSFSHLYKLNQERWEEEAREAEVWSENSAYAIAEEITEAFGFKERRISVKMSEKAKPERVIGLLRKWGYEGDIEAQGMGNYLFSVYKAEEWVDRAYP
jgi:hypothetical protein